MRRWVPKSELGLEPRTVSTTHEGIKPKQRSRIIERAHGACELCHATNKPLHIGHLLSVAKGHELGLTDEQINSDDNLIAECEECNLGRSSASIPPWLVAGLLKSRSTNASH